MDDADVTHYYLSDALGSTMALTDASKGVVNTYEYDVFGAVSASSGSLANFFEFAGEQVDDSTDLQYLRARYYDPAVGRFVSQDPVLGTPGVPGTLNRYPYVLNGPVNYLDPSGLCIPGVVSCEELLDAAEDVGRAAAQTVEVVAYGGYVASYTALNGLGELPDPIEFFFLPLEVQLTLAQAGFLGTAVAMDYLTTGNPTNVYNDPMTGQRSPSDWWPDWMTDLAGLDPNGCYFPCTVLPGVSPGKEGAINIDFQWPLGG